MRRIAIILVAVISGIGASHATVLSGTHQAVGPYMELVQWYAPGPRYQPRYSRPYEYDRPFSGPFRHGDRDIYYPEERQFNRDMRRIDRYNWRTPYRPY